jgi:hypothetical protein
MLRTPPGRPAGLPEPCQPTSAAKPPSGHGWIHEIKYDGYRMMAARADGRTRLITRNGHDWAARYPLIVAAADSQYQASVPYFFRDAELGYPRLDRAAQIVGRRRLDEQQDWRRAAVRREHRMGPEDRGMESVTRSGRQVRCRHECRRAVSGRARAKVGPLSSTSRADALMAGLTISTGRLKSRHRRSLIVPLPGGGTATRGRCIVSYPGSNPGRASPRTASLAASSLRSRAAPARCSLSSASAG